MGLVDLALGPLRAVLGSAEHEAEEEMEEVLPVAKIAGIQEQLLDGMTALRKTAESIELHVAAIDSLAAALPPMTEAVAALTARLGELVELMAPIAAAERDVAAVKHDMESVEHDVERATHYFRRRRPPEEAPANPAPSA